MNKVRVRIYEDNKFVIKSFYRKKIDIFNIEYNQKGNVYTILASDLDRLPFNDIEVLSYKGIKGIINRVTNSKHFIISIILGIIIMFFLSNMIFKVEVVHENKKLREMLRSELKIRGVRPFTFKKGFDKLNKIKEEIKSAHEDEIEWLEIENHGMIYTVKVEERIITKEQTEPQYCDIVSTKDAVITDVISSKGQTLIDKNDYVKKGSTIISGTITLGEEVKSYVCAKGQVYGNTWYTVSISMPLKHIDKTYTAKKSYNLGVIYNNSLKEMFNVHFKDYDTTKKELFKIGGLTFLTEVHREYTKKEKTYTEEEALNAALDAARDKLKSNLEENAEILNEKVLQREVYDSIISVDIFYSVKESIGKTILKNVPEEGVKEDEPTE